MSLVYLYAVVPASAAVETEAMSGIGGARVRRIEGADVAGVVSDVPVAEFDQGPLDLNVADASWLGPRAAAHQEVNARLLDAAGAVLPLAFGTLFRGDDRVRDALRGRERELADGLAAVLGRAEWVVTLDRDRAAALASLEREPPLAALTEEARTAAPGRAYLLERSMADARTSALRDRDRAASAALRSALERVSDQVTDEPLVEGGPAARLTVLARRDGAPALEDALDGFGAAWAERGYVPRVSGPWPPYRYAARIGPIR